MEHVGSLPNSPRYRAEGEPQSNSPKVLNPHHSIDTRKSIEAFNKLNGDRCVLNGEELSTQELTFGERISAWWKGDNFWDTDVLFYGTLDHQNQNKAFKQCFLNALMNAEGEECAKSALQRAGLPKDWDQSKEAIGSDKVKQILTNARLFHKISAQHNEKAMRCYLFKKRHDEEPHPMLARTVARDDKNLWLHIFSQKVRQHQSYTSARLGTEDFKAIKTETDKKFIQKKGELFERAHPHLEAIGDAQDIANINFFNALKDRYTDAGNILNEIEATQKLLAKVDWDHEKWGEQLSDVDAKIKALRNLKNEANKINFESELDHQIDLLEGQKTLIEEFKANDPFSNASLVHSNLVWNAAAKNMLEHATKGLADKVRANTIAELENTLSELDNKATLERMEIPTADNKSKHTIILEKEKRLACVKEILIPKVGKDDAEKFTNKAAREDALRLALNNLPWANDENENKNEHHILVQKNGITQKYVVANKLGSEISKFLKGSYEGEKAQVNLDAEIDAEIDTSKPSLFASAKEKQDSRHARSLMSTTMTESGNGKDKIAATVISHGTISMWGITDQAKREQANQNGAQEVLTAAVQGVVNQRETTSKVKKIVHINTNLTTPAGWREIPIIKEIGFFLSDKLKDYQEQTYTFEQFAAFEKNQGAQKKFTVNNPLSDDEEVVKADVDVIAFSFGINPLATGALFDFIGGWASVYDQNYRSMQRFIGEHLEDPDWFTENALVQGQRPGGFVGDVIEEVENSNLEDDKKSELILMLSRQTDCVRNLFLREEYKSSRGDPAKMTREIGVLQLLAEQVLHQINSDTAATFSTGCKSNKDRAGVVRAEILTKLVTLRLDGFIEPNALLRGDDLMNYCIMSATQLSIQRRLCGIPGSKEIDKLKERGLDEYWRKFLKGLSMLTSE